MGMPVVKPGTITREDSIGNIIESVAMEENAIAHILNAESEKLQAVLNMPDATPQQIIDINNSILKAIQAAIALESSLASKLSSFSDQIFQLL